MQTSLGTPERPLRIAIVGAGPSGFYVAEWLTKQESLVSEIHLIDRLPTPFGLVRSGVAPDHQKIKSVTRVYEKVLAHPAVKFFGNVSVGTDVSVEALQSAYDQVVLAYGAATDSRLGIPGEDAAGSYSATEFVAWYNGDPDFQDRTFNLEGARSAVVIGVGNVAMDVARILAQPPELLASTDITSSSLVALRQSQISSVSVVGRRGAAQAKFSLSEIKEIGEIEGVHLSALADEVKLDEVSANWIESLDDSTPARIVEYLNSRVGTSSSGSRQVHARFLLSPVEILTKDGRVSGVRCERNELVAASGEPKARGTGEFETLAADLVFRSVGYRGTRMPGVPFDDKRALIPNELGRISDAGKVLSGLYTVGWIKRGPSGLIGTNRADARETVDSMLADVTSLADRQLADFGPLFSACRVVDAAGWRRIDAAEVASGKAVGKVREKLVSVPELLKASE